MKKFLVFCMLAFGISMFVNAQQTALTADGKVVILYDNGTWTYADVKAPKKEAQEVQKQGGEVLEQAAVVPVVDDSPIDLKDATVEKMAFIEGPSKKLSKYFKQKNIVRCDLTLTAKDGKAYLQTEWKIMNGEAYSYFGFIKEGNKLTLELIGGKMVDLVYTKEFEPKEYQKYGFSTYSAEVELNEEQIRLLKNAIVYKAHMNWSRRTEEYKVVAPSYFIKSLPQIIE
ncbi:hypothetical protein [Marinifilum caeruleilacunae]|uniref:DUF3157 family protein n=1 Tax=Marinifilum caeruleilacunae TaxID=2499076 RepID=A0ABX1X195_9BACT|nr:hypothetical protein [Marinifilum caeruleilacunae]NOU62057.1 hypothetical protein [Marinifilum caeruleilacunae]